MSEWIVQDWFNNEFWPLYDAKYCGGGSKKGPKSKALESCKKKIKTPEKALEVILALREQIRYFNKAQSMGKWQPNFPMVMTWVNQERWTTEIDSFTDGVNPIPQELGRCEMCSKPVHGPKYNRCGEHLNYEEHKEKTINWLKDKGLMKLKTESAHEWHMRCREHIVECKSKISERFI